MSDLMYFRTLLDEAKDPAMVSFYQEHVRQRNAGSLGSCEHIRSIVHVERSYGSTYYWNLCPDCGKEFNHSSQDPW